MAMQSIIVHELYKTLLPINTFKQRVPGYHPSNSFQKQTQEEKNQLKTIYKLIGLKQTFNSIQRDVCQKTKYVFDHLNILYDEILFLTKHVSVLALKIRPHQQIKLSNFKRRPEIIEGKNIISRLFYSLWVIPQDQKAYKSTFKKQFEISIYEMDTNNYQQILQWTTKYMRENCLQLMHYESESSDESDQ